MTAFNNALLALLSDFDSKVNKTTMYKAKFRLSKVKVRPRSRPVFGAI